jgi:nucleoside phosphorylase/tetratricopeptide (TPR) repeat protein
MTTSLDGTVTVVKTDANSQDELPAETLKGLISIGIIAIREDEFQSVLDHFSERRRVIGRTRYYEYARLRTTKGTEAGIAIARSPEQGQGSAQALANDMIEELAPLWILLVGIAGGVPDAEFSLGDVILSSRVHDFSVSAALEGGGLEFQQQGGPVHTDVERILSHLPAMRDEFAGWDSIEKLGCVRPTETVPAQPDDRYYGSEDWQKKTHNSLAAHFGSTALRRVPIFKVSPVMTSNTLVKDARLAEQWKTSSRQAAAIEMELGGVYIAARYGGSGATRVLAIRGISDIVGYKRSFLWTAFACKTAASFAYSLIASGVLDDPRKAQHEPPASPYSALKSPFIGVPPRIAVFTGRSAEIDAIKVALADARPAVLTPMKSIVARAAVRGMGGVGKTSVAAEFAYRYRDQFGGVYWCSAETRIGLLTSLAKLGAILSDGPSAESNLEEAARNTLHLLDQQAVPWLVVYDNIKQPSDVLDLLPAVGTKLIITSRFFDWITWAHEIPINVLPMHDAVSFLNSRTGRDDAAGAKKLAEVLGELPLVLDQAAASCRLTQTSFEEYSSNATKMITSEASYDPQSTSVRATFEIALAGAVAKCPDAEALITYLAQCAPERIPMHLVDGAIDDASKRERAIVALAEVSLIKHDPFESSQRAITVHRVVQAISGARSSGLGQDRSAAERLIVKLSEMYPDDGYHNSASWDLCSELTPHVLFQFAHFDAAATKLQEWPRLLNATASYLQGRASLAAAVSMFKAALAIRIQVLGPKHPLTANSHSNYATVLTELGDGATAKVHHERALAVREEVLSPDDPDLATSLINLAVTIQKDDPKAARTFFERALAIREKVFGLDHPTTAHALRHLGQLLIRQNELVAARPLIVRAVDIWAQQPESIHTAMGLIAMGHLVRKEGNFGGAEVFYRRALAIWEKDRSDHSVTNRLRNDLAQVLLQIGNPIESLKLSEQVLSSLETIVGSEHPAVTDAANLAVASLEKLGRKNEADALRARYGLTSRQT